MLGGGAEVAVDHLALRVDQEHRRQRDDAVLDGQPTLHAARLEDLRPGQRVLLEEGVKLGPLVVEVHADDLEGRGRDTSGATFFSSGSSRLTGLAQVAQKTTRSVLPRYCAVSIGSFCRPVPFRTSGLPTRSSRRSDAGGLLGRLGRRGNPVTSWAYCLLRLVLLAVELVGAGELEQRLGGLVGVRMPGQEVLEVGHPDLLVGQDVGAGLVVLHGEVDVDQAEGGVRAELAALGGDLVDHLAPLRIERRCGTPRPGCRSSACCRAAARRPPSAAWRCRGGSGRGRCSTGPAPCAARLAAAPRSWRRSRPGP